MKWIGTFISLALLISCGMAQRDQTAYRENLQAEFYDMVTSTSESLDKTGRGMDDDARVQTKEERPQSGETEAEKKIYFGSCRLQVAEPVETRGEIAQLAADSGGYVEAIYEQHIIIRVPKELFDEVFTTIQELGEVLHKTVETYDVSEYFQDLSTRLEVATRARERLYALLEKTTDVEERLKILKEIKRLSEEIENINLNLESIKNLIAFSRITVQLEARLSHVLSTDKSTIPFPWIGNLDPFYPSLRKLRGKISLELGEEFAVFDKEDYYHAESPDRITVRVGTTDNHPRGDAEFWEQALAYHLTKFYKSAEVIDLPELGAVLFSSKDKDPFYYLVCVAAGKKRLHIAEVLFPNTDSYTAQFEAIKSSLAEMEVRR